MLTKQNGLKLRKKLKTYIHLKFYLLMNKYIYYKYSCEGL